MLILIGLFGVVFGLLAWVRPLLAAGFIVATLPVYQIRFEVSDVPFTVLELMILLFVIVVLIREFKQLQVLLRKSPFIPALLVLGFVLIATASLWWTPDLTAGLGIWKAYCVEPVLFAVALYFVLKKMSDIAFLLSCVWALAIGVALVALYQFATGVGIPEPWNLWPDRRAVGVFEYPNAVGLLLAPIVMTAIAWLIHSKNWLASWKLKLTHQRAMHWLAGVTTLFGILAVFGARADGAAVAIAATTAFLLLFTRFRLATIAICIIGFIALLAIPQTREILLFQDVSGDVRLALWKGTANLIQHQPLQGAGIGAFPQVYDIYRLPSHVELLQYPHNLLLDFWVEFGILGPIWLIGFFILTFKCLFSKRTRSHNAALLMAAPFITTIIYGLVDSPYFKNDLSVLFWFWIALSYFLLWDSIKTPDTDSAK